MRLASLLLASSLWGAETLIDLRVPMRDGTKLSTHIFLPSLDGSYPVILARTPYGKAGVLPSGYRMFVDKGYGVVWQDVRGRGLSEGTMRFLEQEGPDGYDTLTWVARQPWSNGRVGMVGGSYQGLAQWKVAVLHHPNLRAIFPVHAGTDDYYDRFYWRGGAMKLGHRLLWLAENLRLPGTQAASFDTYTAHLPLRTADRAATGRTVHEYQQALNHPGYDERWRGMSARNRIATVRIPVFSIAGWFDPNVESDLEAITMLQEIDQMLHYGAGRHIVVGPWGHDMNYQTHADANARLPVSRLQLEFFDAWLKGLRPGRIAKARVFVMGTNRWRDFETWPPESHALHLFFNADGTLTQGAEHRRKTRKYVYDPANPVPTIGGQACCNPRVFPWGPLDQRPLDGRKDILRFETAPLNEPVTAIGQVTVTLSASSSAPRTDFTAKLIDVWPTGEARLIADGVRRGAPGRFAISLGPTAIEFAVGHRIRLDISSSNFPKYDRHPNTATPVADERSPVRATQGVVTGGPQASYVTLPVTSRR